MKRVAADELHLRKAVREVVGQFRIEFHRNYVLCAFEQKFRQRAFAWTDLGNEGFILGTGRNGNAPENGLVGEEVLA